MNRKSKYWLCACLVAAVFISSCKDNKDDGSNPPAESYNPQLMPQPIAYQVIRTYPHDPADYTEGLEMIDSTIYESTGNYGASVVKKYNLFTGMVLAQSKLNARYFGEGLTVLNGKVYQLTYHEKDAFVYQAGGLKQIAQFMTTTPEAWGMTHDNTYLIYDDGSEVIHFLDTVNFKEGKHITVTDEHGPVKYVNELELIKGYLYANVWQTDYIIKIDTATGRVVGRADLSDLRRQTGIPPLSMEPGKPEVLNGIAYNAQTNKIYITGKHWGKMFEVQLDN